MEFRYAFRTRLWNSPSRSARNVARLTVNNPSPFTFYGTNSYLVGRDSLGCYRSRPGGRCPFRRSHASHCRTAGEPYRRQPHAPRPLTACARGSKQATGAITVGEGPHRAARPLRAGETTRSTQAPIWISCRTSSSRTAISSQGDGWSLETVLTPGHTANHAAFALRRDRCSLLGRSRHGMVDLDRRAAGWRDVRLYGLAGQAAGRGIGSICPAMAGRSPRPPPSFGA